jgi:hypothetical protein
MPNYVTIRLGLSGPDYEISRFLSTCIRAPRDDDDVSFDCEGLVPMPDAIVQTLDARDETTRQQALLSTGYESWYSWSIVHWGTKWNASGYHEYLREAGRFECCFSTATDYPEPLMRALAAQFPQLTGVVLAIEPGNDWAYVGDIRGGYHTGSSTDITHRLENLIYEVDGGIPVPPSQPIDRGFQGLGLEAAQFGIHSPAHAKERVASLWSGFYAHLALQQQALISLAADGLAVLAYFERFDEDHAEPEELKDELATYAGSCQSVDFYLQERRCATRVDRKVINAVCSAVMISQANQIVTRAALKELLAETLGKCAEQDLRDWAEIALYRNNTVLRTGSRDELIESVISYAHHLLDLLVDEVRRHIVATDETPRRAA